MKQLLLILLLFVPVCVCAQVRESFDGPEITSNYSWQGDVDQFAIVDGWLVSRAEPVDYGTVSIKLPIDYAPSMTWEFEVRINHSPSDRNNIRVYVYTDDMSAAGVIADYYVQIGCNGESSIMFRRHVETEKSAKK